MKIKSHFIEQDQFQLHLAQLGAFRESATPVLMIHGAIENGKIFYNHKGKGLGWYLAEKGYDVYVLDLRGRGKSSPTIASGHKHRQLDYISQDIPLAIDWLYAKYAKPAHLVAHSWGGTLVMASLLRFPALIDKTHRQVFVGVKRRILKRSWERWLKLELVWNILIKVLGPLYGYVPTRQFGVGADNETIAYCRDMLNWIKASDWCDPQDGFDYDAACENLLQSEIRLPETCFITGKNDTLLGHIRDVTAFRDELKMQGAPCIELAREAGNLQDYDHINILTHPAAIHDHFPNVDHWLKHGSWQSTE